MQNDILSDQDVSADAITICMKTAGNTLSVWQIDEEEKIKDAVLAIVSGGEHLDTIDVICMERLELEEKGFRLQATPGRTPVKELSKQHIDLCDLTYGKLGILAELTVQVFKEERVVRYTVGNLKKLINEAINLGRLQKNDLNESLRDKI